MKTLSIIINWKALLTLTLISLTPLMGHADNPIVSHVYTADPAARVFNGRVYVITTHDQDTQSDYSQLHDYYLFSSDDMVNWQDHGVVWNSRTQTSWASLAYAPDFIERNGKYYLYFPNGANSIGVAVADRPEGPYVDAIGRPLVDRNTPNGNVDWVFDPGVFIDDDGQAYLYFGGGGPGNARVIRLNNDMISTSGSAITIDAPNFFEALYMHKRNGIYYLSYSTNTAAGLRVDYMTSNNPTSGFQYRGVVLGNPWENNNNNNHASILEYNNQWYAFYHNRAIANARGASTYQRSINVDRLYYNANGTIQQVNVGPTGVPKIKNVNAFAVNQAEMFSNENGVETEPAADGTLNLQMSAGDWVRISNVDFGSGATGINARIASAISSGLEVRLGSVTNAPVATLQVTNTGGWQTWQTLSASFSRVTGVHDVFLRVSSGHLNLNWYQFTGGVSTNTLRVELESLSGQSGFSPFSVFSDSAASGGQYIVWSNSGNNEILGTPSDTATGQMAINFTLSQAANVSFQIQADFPNADDDSFYYKLDSGAWNTQNNTPANGWTTLTPTTFSNVSAGSHTLRILRREDGAKLDRITLTASAGQISAGGTPVSSSSSSNSSSSSSSVSSPAGNNFAVNGGLETSLVNWGATAGTATRSTQQSRTGSASAFITGRTASWNGLTFNPGALTIGNEYEVSVWVRLAAGSPDSVVMLTAKRQDDSDSSTYNEYTRVAMATASANNWTLLEGYYTHTGTPFQHFIIESDNTTVSYYADDFSISGTVDPGPNTGHPFFIGNITTSGAVRSDFIQYWDQITPENEGKWGSIEGTRDVYNWAPLDRIYTFARQNNIPVKAHTFVWGNQSPAWLNNLSGPEVAGEIEEWIRDYCARYPDTAMIDVVNESTPGHAPATYAQRAYGNDWIIRVFQLARQYCPNSILILNDYNVLSWNTAEFIAMARPAVEAGVVDALGLQAHGLEDWSLNDVSNKLNQVAALGLPIYISEYDVARTNDQQQLQIMQQQFPLFYNHPSVVGITLWGYVVGRTWVNGSGLIQENGTPRPAMTWLMNYLDR